MFEQFAWVGRDLYDSGAVSSHGGNLSVRVDADRLLITRTGSSLGHLTEGDIIATTIAPGGARDA